MSGTNLLLALAVTAGLVYFTGKLANRIPQHFRDKQWWPFSLKLLSCVTLTPIVCFGLLMVLLGSVTYYPRRDFDKAIWSRYVEKRYTMVDDLSERIVGWDKRRVLDTLGAPNYEEGTTSFRYATGDPPQLFGGADPFEIVIEFQDGKVSNCYIHET